MLFQQSVGLRGAEGNAAFAGAGGVVGTRAFGWTGGFLLSLIQMQQLATEQGAELRFEAFCQLAGEGEYLFLVLGIAAQVAFAEACHHAEPGKRAASAAHATQSGTESGGDAKRCFLAQPETFRKGREHRLCAIESAMKICQSAFLCHREDDTLPMSLRQSQMRDGGLFAAGIQSVSQGVPVSTVQEFAEISVPELVVSESVIR